MALKFVDRRGVLASLAAMVLMPSASPAQRRSGRAIVIGAGVAGLACARDMRRAGLEVVVLEAQTRIGGRLKTSRHWADLPVELGASWIHGVTGNPAASAARSAGLELQPADYDNRAVYEAGAGLLGRQALARLEAVERRLERHMQSAPGEALARACRTRPRGTIANRVARQVNLDATGESKRQRAQFAINSIVEHEFGTDFEHLSRCFWTEGEALPGGDAWVGGGFDRLAQSLADGLDIRLGQRVAQVDYRGNGVAVTTADGVEQADVVIVTVPLGVLQAGHIRFEPGLPSTKLEAIDALGSGLLNKCVLRFDAINWPRNIEIFNRLADARGEWSEFVNLGAYDQGAAIMAFNAGSFAHELESASDATTGMLALEALRSMFGSSFPEPTALQVTRWAGDENAFGSHSFPIEATRADTRIRLLDAVDNRIFFAGEATSTNAPGTVHGAMRSGRAAAVAVVER
ncbi:FAD-dependent oxidoreductase [Maricaulis salignorans]|uniref:FAD-dependent oxidoreductase n=1 Tax=Maricaulis salignorans TaxID=144026 RepID=UPI000B837D57|nr:FAD-dependent oxidoreductase [Maricaulis salignorans]